jgi:hypothetical protein
MGSARYWLLLVICCELLALPLGGVAVAQAQRKQSREPNSSSPPAEAWHRDSTTSRMGDPPGYSVTAPGKELLHSPTATGALRLYLSCGGRGGNAVRVSLLAEVVLDAQLDLNGLRVLPVRIRLDDSAPRSESWIALAGFQAAWASFADWQYVRALADASRLLVEVPVYGAGPQVVEFSLDGYPDAISWFETSCALLPVHPH